MASPLAGGGVARQGVVRNIEAALRGRAIGLGRAPAASTRRGSLLERFRGIVALESPVVKEAVGPRPADMDAEAKVGACSELQANQRWPELSACADELAALDARDRSVQATADEFRDRANHEAACALVVRKLTAAIAEGNLREAQQLLTSIEPDSVYLSRASKAFHAAEARAVDDNRRTALVLAATNDCAGIRRLQTLVNVSGTPAVVGAVAAVAAKCVDRVQP